MAYDHKSEAGETFKSPLPSAFDEYLPWACSQLQVEVDVLIMRVLQKEYVSTTLTDRSKARTKNKAKGHLRNDVTAIDDKEDSNASNTYFQTHNTNNKVVRINTTYDCWDNLVQIKFDKNKNIPRTVFKILGLIIKFHINLTSLTINRGLDKYSIHEICKLLPKSQITDLCLDGTYLQNAEYYLLLEKSSCLRQLSLARCKIDNDALKNIAQHLVDPLPASKTLCVLNISTNRFNDTGVKYLAEALKSNRQLLYLNLADNMITDEGVSALLDALIEFPLSSEELLQSRHRYVNYLKERKEMIAKLSVDLKVDDRKVIRRKTTKPSISLGKKTAKGLEKKASLKSIADANRSLVNLNAAIHERAETLAMDVLGPFIDSYSNMNTTSKDGIVYCLGNNTLSYINLSYTNISYFSLKKILKVLMYQKLLDRNPRGLVNLCVEGNAIPTSCKELTQIQDILEIFIMTEFKYSVLKKRRASRGK